MKLKHIVESLESTPKSVCQSYYNPNSQEKYLGFLSRDTGIDKYDKLKDDEYCIVNMSPDDYLNIIHDYFDKDLNHVYKSLSEEGVLDLLQKMKDGVQLNIPILDFKDSFQDGRHRAIAAKMYGLQVIPVLVVESEKLPSLSSTANFDNSVSKLSKSRVLVDLDELCNELGVNKYTEIKPALERVKNITFKIKDDSGTRRDKRRKLWKKFTGTLLGMY